MMMKKAFKDFKFSVKNIINMRNEKGELIYQKN